MAFHYLIDGYNVLYALREIPSGTWQRKREQFLDFLRRRRPQGNNPVTVVFDSREGLGDQSRQGDFRILFTAGETADERIGTLVREAKNPREIRVVSNDRGIQTLIRGTGAKFVTATEFLKGNSPTPHGRSGRKPQSIGKPEADEITQELKERWL